ncbi:MAG: DUF58 domain-containing protein [Chthoniobacterales bacterium]
MFADQTNEFPELDERFLRRLEALRLQLLRSARHTSTRDFHGRRLSRHSGSSLEFSEYLAYSPGDDFRHVDWSVYARLGRLYSKRFESEQELHVHILIDVSRSMYWQPDPTDGISQKSTLALRLAATLSYLVLHHLDRIHLYFFDDKIIRTHHSRQNRLAIPNAFRFLNAVNSRHLPPAHPESCSKALHEFIRQNPHPGSLLIISDFFDPTFLLREKIQEILQRCRVAKLDTTLLQTLHIDELAPPARSFPPGEILLNDFETDGQIHTFTTRNLSTKYRKKICAYNEQLSAVAHANGFGYAQINTAQNFEKDTFPLLRESQLI